MPTTVPCTYGQLLHRSGTEGDRYFGPDDVYRFLATGEETGGAFFAMEATVLPGGGPPPHLHRREDETFYVVEGECEILLGTRTIHAVAGDFVNVSRDTVHCFTNTSDETMRMIVTFSPAGMERFFEETLERITSPDQRPAPVEEIVARYEVAAPAHGLEFV